MDDWFSEQTDVDFGRNFAALAERDIDLLLLEEFQVNRDFVDWFCSEISVLDIKPGGAWHSVFDADGESDLLIRVYHGCEKIGILLENKIAAVEQPGQALRYHIRGNTMIKQTKLSKYLTVICAPESYLKSRDNLGPNAYDHNVSYEKIMAWFTAQNNCRAVWRAHVIREAIDQSRRGYTMVIDGKITDFQKKYWNYLQKNYPHILMKKPGMRGPRSTWIILKGRNFPKGVHLNHKMNENIIELAFSKTKRADVLVARLEWPPDLIFTQKGNEATISRITQMIDPRSDFDEQIPALETAFKAAEQLMQYCAILEPCAR